VAAVPADGPSGEGTRAVGLERARVAQEADLVSSLVLQWPGGPVYAQALIHHIYMEHVGRENWRLSQQRPLAPLQAGAQVMPGGAEGVLA